MIEVQYSPRFLKQFERLDPTIQRRFKLREAWFVNDPHDQRLRTHPLHGELEGFWAFWVTPSVRVVFSFEPKSRIRFHRIGSHDVSYR